MNLLAALVVSVLSFGVTLLALALLAQSGIVPSSIVLFVLIAAIISSALAYLLLSYKESRQDTTRSFLHASATTRKVLLISVVLALMAAVLVDVAMFAPLSISIWCGNR